MQRLKIDVNKYSILNMHKIGIDVPARYIFEELETWNGMSTCWPNHIANVGRIDDKLENIQMFLFGLKKYPFGFKNNFLGFRFIPLFNLKAIHFHEIPEQIDSDNARYLLYESSGGYPIGIFSMYVRSSISDEQEKHQSQLFIIVGFNFYGKEEWAEKKLINRLWEAVHDRVTSNVLNKLKQLSEWRFQKLQDG
jgi:hypothetical protein